MPNPHILTTNTGNLTTPAMPPMSTRVNPLSTHPSVRATVASRSSRARGVRRQKNGSVMTWLTPLDRHRYRRTSRRTTGRAVKDGSEDKETPVMNGKTDGVRARARNAVREANEALGETAAVAAVSNESEEEEATINQQRGKDVVDSSRMTMTVEKGKGFGSSSSSSSSSVKLIVTDVDGTLLSSKQELSEATADALRRAAELGVPTVLATGKTRGPWTKDIYERIGKTNAEMPGLFIQGLIVSDGKGQTKTSETLDASAAKSILRFAKTRGCVIIAFCDDTIVCSKRNASTDRVLDYGEPEPVECGDLLAKSDEYAINKLLLFGDEEAVARYRTEAESVLAGACDITVAVPGMLEFLPKGASKGAAVRALCESMGVDAADVLAMGDGENDKEMLAFAGVGVAVGNASAAAKKAATYTLEETNDQDAVAKAIERFVIEPRRREEAKEAKQSEMRAAATRKAEATIARAKEKVKQDMEAERNQAMEADAQLKAETEEKILGIVRTIAKGAKNVSEALVAETEKGSAEAKTEDKEITDEDIKSSMDSFDSFDSVDDDVVESIDEETRRQLEEVSRATKESQALLERQRANQARLKKLQEELEAAKLALARSEGSANASDAQPGRRLGTEEDEIERIRSETNIINARTSLKKAAQKAVSDASAAKKAVSTPSAEETAESEQEGRGLFGFIASAMKTVSALRSPEAIKRQKDAARAAAKANLLAQVVNSDGGRDCPSETMSRIMEQVRILENSNPTTKGARSTLMLGRWSCSFTNSPELLGTEGLNIVKRSGPVFFCYDLDTERCEIDRGWPLRRLRAQMTYTNNAAFDLEIPSARVLGISMPAKTQRDYSSLTVTYLDLDLQICRGLNDTIYVFIQNDPLYRMDASASDGVDPKLLQNK